MPAISTTLSSELPNFLNGLTLKFHRKEYLNSDPLEFVHFYDNPYDKEVVALISSQLAYGRVTGIRRSIDRCLAVMGKLKLKPSEMVRELGSKKSLDSIYRAFKFFVHRFNTGQDVVNLMRLLSNSWNHYGSLGAHFHSFDFEPLKGQATIQEPLVQMLNDWRHWSEKFPGSKYFHFFLTSPAFGSACKRWCMFLRWMGRKDDLDPGLWTKDGGLGKVFANQKWLNSSQLIIPLDTHVARISRYIGLTERKSTDWTCAMEVTRSLRLCDQDDPTRYDFSISRLGILNLCKKKYVSSICRFCDLSPGCKYVRVQAS